MGDHPKPNAPQGNPIGRVRQVQSAEIGPLSASGNRSLERTRSSASRTHDNLHLQWQTSSNNSSSRSYFLHSVPTNTKPRLVPLLSSACLWRASSQGFTIRCRRVVYCFWRHTFLGGQATQVLEWCVFLLATDASPPPSTVSTNSRYISMIWWNAGILMMMMPGDDRAWWWRCCWCWRMRGRHFLRRTSWSKRLAGGRSNTENDGNMRCNVDGTKAPLLEGGWKGGGGREADGWHRVFRWARPRAPDANTMCDSRLIKRIYSSGRGGYVECGDGGCLEMARRLVGGALGAITI